MSVKLVLGAIEISRSPPIHERSNPRMMALDGRPRDCGPGIAIGPRERLGSLRFIPFFSGCYTVFFLDLIWRFALELRF